MALLVANWEFVSALLAILALLLTITQAFSRLRTERDDLKAKRSELQQQLNLEESLRRQREDNLRECKEDRARLISKNDRYEDRIQGFVRRHDSNRDRINQLEAELRDRSAGAGARPESAVLAEKDELIERMNAREDELQEALEECQSESQALEDRVAAYDRITEESWRLGFNPLDKLTKRRPPAPSMRTMRVASFVNQKGGVGKTTMCFNFGHRFAADHPDTRVLLIDLDTQGNLARLCGEEDKAAATIERDQSIWATFVEQGEIDLGNFVSPSHHMENVDVLSASRSMNNFEGELYRLLFTADEERDPRGVFLHQLANEIAGDARWDLVCFDCPPARGMVTESALLASDFFAIPVEPSDYTVEGAFRVKSSIRELHEAKTGQALRQDSLRIYLNKVRFYGQQVIGQQRGSIESYRSKFGDTMAPEACWLTSSPGSLAGQTDGPVILKRGRSEPERELIERMQAAYEDFLEHISSNQA